MNLAMALRLGAIGASKVGAGVSIGPIRAAVATNYPGATGLLADATYTKTRQRIPFRIASCDQAQLILSYNGWSMSGSGATNYPNAYSVDQVYIEKNGQTFAVQVTFSAAASKTINPGDTDIQSDPILPSAFGLTKFTKGDLYWYRDDRSVALTTDRFPTSNPGYTSYGAGAVGLKLAAGAVVAPSNGYGTMTFTSGWANYANPYMPIILGRALSGDTRSVIAAGDSIVSGQGDVTADGLVGSFTRALFDTDRVSNPVAGINFGIAGVTAGVWNNGTGDKLRAYLKYCTHCYEAFGTNDWITSPGSTTAAAIAASRVIWDACAAVGTDVLRPKLIPRTTGNITTALNAEWASGGRARAFNVALESESGITRITRNALRAGVTEGTDAFYQWGSGTYTTDFTHPIPAGVLLDAADLRAAIAANV